MRLLCNRKPTPCSLPRALAHELAGELARRLRRYEGTIQVLVEKEPLINGTPHGEEEISILVTIDGINHSFDYQLLDGIIQLWHGQLCGYERTQAFELADPALLHKLAQPIKDALARLGGK